MANYYYDGSFDGLLTVIYMAYEDRENKMLRVNANTEQLILSFEGIRIATFLKLDVLKKLYVRSYLITF